MAKVALLIGVSEYEVGLNPLPAAVKDVVALQRILKDSEMGDFDEVKILTNPEPQAMQYEVETLFSGRSKDDFVLLFFSGHGIKDDSNNLYFATRITKKSAKGDLIRSTAVPARFVHEVMNNSRAKRQAIILDCCFSGAFDPSLFSKDDGSVDLQGQLGAEGRVVLTSSSSTQYSFEQQGSDLSLYTRYLIEGIETGAGDRDEDGKISVRELHEYATSKVQETAPNMTPKLITLKDMGFDLVLAKAKIADPKLRYRRQVEKYSGRGAISSTGRIILDRLQIQLGLSASIAKAIETEVLRPYQERLDNIRLYQDQFAKAVKNEYPLSRHVLSELENLLEILGLRRKDVDAIEQEIIAKQSGSVKIPRTEPPKVQPQHRKEDTSPPQNNPRIKGSKLSEDKDSSVMRYAGFWRRGIALIIDVPISVGIGFGANTLVHTLVYNSGSHFTVPTIIGFLCAFVYYILFEISPLRGTIGKLITGLQVTNIYGNNIGFWGALLRIFIKTVSIACFGVGIIYLAFAFFFSKKEQGIHDFIAKSVVVTKENLV
jgi:uncharacterized RDD family membrane protein YckC